MTTTKAVQGTVDVVTRKVVLSGLEDIMFDRYAGDNETKLEPWQKMYFADDGKSLVLPARNILSFLSAQNTDSAPKRILDARKYKKFALACLSFVSIKPRFAVFKRDGKPVVFGKFVGDIDPVSGVYIDRTVARLEKGIPNPKVRPVLPTPWNLEFTLTLYPNQEIQETQLINVFEKGGLALGLGTFRGQYGKFRIETWE